MYGPQVAETLRGDSGSDESPRRRVPPAALERYFGRGSEHVAALPVVRSDPRSEVSSSPRLAAVTLPPWAADIGVNGDLLVPASAVRTGKGLEWMLTDWFGAAEWYICGAAERAFEAVHGPIHSYSHRLRGWDSRIWERAWANRIALFLRRWAAREKGTDETALFGELPRAEISVTHDVDAVEKTLAIRIKQSAFHLFNAARHGDPKKVGDALRFFTRRSSMWFFDEILRLEDECGIKSEFCFYAGPTGWLRSPKKVLLDPDYDVSAPRLRRQIRNLYDGGRRIGLHQSFDAWRDAEAMSAERGKLQAAADVPVTSCRQHWLRFSWSETWAAQRQAGFTRDMTLGFNDRPGFRNGGALAYRPFGDSFEVLPNVLMDSHLYDYGRFTDEEQRAAEMRRWIGEIRAVRGQAAVLWHQQVMGEDYGWAPGFTKLLQIICEE